MIPAKYRVKQFGHEEIRPEETLADSLSQHSVVEAPIGYQIFQFVYLIIIFLAVLVVVKSFQLQIVRGKDYVAAVKLAGVVKYFGPALRGIIYDANNQPLVENVATFDLIGLQTEFSHSPEELRQNIGALAEIININLNDLMDIIEANKKSSTFLIKSNLSKEEIAKIQHLTPPGIYVVTNAQRHYLRGNIFSSVLGYTAKVSPTDLKADDYYLLSDRVGRLGLEQSYEKFLRGEHRDVTLKSKNISNYQLEPKPGNNLLLNLDAEIQVKLFKAMNKILASAGLSRGASVVQNVKTGAILGLVSLPVYDNNTFENYFNPDGTDKISKILENKNKPLFNRVISGRYSPGSTIKPLFAMAGLQEGVITPETTIYANGSITVKSIFDPSVIYTFNDWKVHGLTDLKKAIADSVDVYFYALGGGYGNIKGLGYDRMAKYLKSALAGDYLNIDLPGEVSGFVPTPAWKKSVKGEDWFIGDTYNVSIGQGDLTVTPLWLNAYVGAIANDGNLMRPFIVKEIRDLDYQLISQNEPKILAKLPFDEGTRNIVKDGMRQTILSGTATMLQGLPVSVAAKTGTAQVTGRGLNSLFVVFGPYDNPEIVMTVLVENIVGQGLAIQVANEFLSWYFNRQLK